MKVLENRTNNISKIVEKNFSKNVTIDIITRIGYLATRFFIPPFVLSHLTLEAYGLWSTAFVLVAYLGISNLGLSNAYIKFTAEYSAKKENEKINQLISTGLMVSIPLSLILFFSVYYFWPQISRFLQIPSSLEKDAFSVVLMVVAIFLLSLSLSVFKDVLVGLQKLSIVQLIWTFSYIAETILIFVLITYGRGIKALAEAFFVRTLLEITLSTFVAFYQISWLKISPSLWSKNAVKELFAFGGTVQVLGFLSIILNSIERAITVPLLGLAAAAVMDIGKKLPAMAASIPSAFSSSLIPAAAYLKGGLSEGEEKIARRNLYLTSSRYMNLTAAYICGFLATLSLPILNVWVGNNFPQATVVMIIFSISIQVHLMTGTGTAILKGLGKAYEEFYYVIPNICALIVIIPLIKIIFGNWSIENISLGVTLSTVFAASLFVKRANNLLGVRNLDYFKTVIWPGIIPYLIGLFFLYPALLTTSNSNRYLSLLIIIFIGLLYSLFLIVSFYLFASNEVERTWLLKKLKNNLVFTPN